MRALFWGNRVGKTEWGAETVARYSLGDLTSEHEVLLPNGEQARLPFIPRKVLLPIEIWCACPSYDLQKETTQKKLEKVIPHHRIIDRTFVKKNTWGEIILDNGTKINFKSYEQGREKFQGTGKRLIWFDEEPPKDIWEECFVRSEAGIPLDIIMTMTPVNGMTWVYDEIYLDTSNTDLFVSEADWDDNPFLLPEQKAQMSRGLTPEALKVRREGKFVKRVGLVLPWWQRGIHVQDLEHQASWITDKSALDFGFSNPACWGLFGVDYDDNINLFAGFYERGLTTPRIVDKVYNTLTHYKIDPKNHTVICDSAQAQSIQEANDYSVEKQYGISFVGVKKISGTDNQNWDEYRAEKMLQYGEVREDKKTKFVVSSRLMTYDEKAGKDVNWFVKEAEGLKWNEVASPTSGDKQQGAMWDPRYPNHAIDMYSYFLVDHLDKPGAPGQPDPTAGKIPGTFIPMSVPDDEENQWDNSTYEEEEVF